MMARIKDYWAGLSQRERVLLGVMAALLAVVILWLGVMRPVDNGLRDAHMLASDALDRNAAIRAKVKQLDQLPRAVAAPTGDLAQIVGQSAGEAGFTLERAQPQGTGRVDIAIASAKPTALFDWIAGLEGQGIVVETLSVRPAPLSGAISAQAMLKAAGQ